MTVMVHEPLTRDDVLLEGFLALDTPEGFRAELIDGEIVVTPPPGGDHDACVSEIDWQVTRHSTVVHRFSGTKGLAVPSGGRCLKSLVIPDGIFAPAEVRPFRGAESWMSAENVSMVVEVTSSRPEHDRTTKRHCYARAGIPLYLLVDREEEKVTLFSGPLEDDYRHADRIPFGKTLPLPGPFEFELDTSEFV